MVFSRKSSQGGGESVTPPSPSASRQAPPPPPPAPPPPPKAATQDAGPAESIIGANLTIEGQSITMRCKGALRVNGSIQAEVHSLQLVIGEQASVSGALVAETINIHGRVMGAILGSRVTLHSTAVVEGDIHSLALTIEQGASFDGRSRKVQDAREITPQVEAPNLQAHASYAPPASPAASGEESNLPFPRTYT